MSNDVVAAIIFTLVALVGFYLWLVVIAVVRSMADRRRWRNARSSASTHFNFTPEREHTS